MTYEANAARIRVERWDGDEFVVTVDGRPVGGTLHKPEATNIARWLASALSELQGRSEALLDACRLALSHVEELRGAWRTGAITEHDGTRSNRNVAVEVALRGAVEGEKG